MATQASPAQESSAPAAAEQEEAPREPCPPEAATERGAAAAAENKVEVKEEEEEEEGECGLFLFMDAGGCKDAFMAWEECVAAVAAQEEDAKVMAERCRVATSNLIKCMTAHADYYAPVLRAQQAFNQRAEAAAAAAASKGEPAASPKQADSVTGEGKEEETVAEESLSN
ncbi:hypothetical protein HU200_056110 [Digitaria exilis]|uniref:GCK domain-containing protein n=1 Tax=Digitaria exilis TaxID=1010633 RepID=A0A835AG18_9POAL|nr:hypothetical protein HU200_056110 [Digitaria exilis]CAB3480268.1 unnamed protein product [Digitaria exilis]